LKTLFKLAIVALLANALVRFAVPYWHHHQFESELKSRVLFWRDSTDEAILQDVYTLAEQNAVPIDAGNVTLRRDSERVFVHVEYVRTIEFVPTVARAWPFEVNVSGLVLRAPGAPR
jgi:hypothetical protein